MVWLIFWIVLLAAALVLEATHVRILGLWYAAGAFCGAVAVVAGLPVWAQFAIAVPVTVSCYFVFKPLARKFRKEANKRAWAQSFIGRHAVVTEEVNASAKTGKVEVDQIVLKAKPKTRDQVLPVGARAVISDVHYGYAIVRLSHRQNKRGMVN